MSKINQCKRCNGYGVIPAFKHVHGGTCFDCHGHAWVSPFPGVEPPKSAAEYAAEDAKVFEATKDDPSFLAFCALVGI